MPDSVLLQKLGDVEARFEAVESRLSDPAITSNIRELTNLTRERSQLTQVVDAFRLYRTKLTELAQSQELLKDADSDVRTMARDEVARLEGDLGPLEARLRVLLLPRDPNDEKNVILEIRAGTGGDEASLFAGDLLRMY